MLALAALGMLLWRAWRPVPRAERPLAVASTRALTGALAEGVRRPVVALDLTLDSLPGARERDWARAIAGAGTSVRWRVAAPGTAGDAGASPDAGWHTSVSAEPLADPSGRLRLVAQGPAGATLLLGDEAGSLDSSTVAASGARVLDAIADGVVTARRHRGVASTARRDSVLLRPVLVLASAGWEGKFVVAALEEAGWRVDARFSVAPQVAVRQGDGAIDTVRYSAVIALDGSAAREAPAVARFVRSGGGAIVMASAASIPALAAILPARVGAPVAATLGALSSDEPRRGLGGHALVAPMAATVSLERSGGAVRVAGSRVELGRVVLVGYDDTWRWRMEGGEGAPDAHRAWWSALVGSVARAPLVPIDRVPAADEAPYVALHAALGSPSLALAAGDERETGAAADARLLAVLLGALLAEWASRRLRGAR